MTLKLERLGSGGRVVCLLITMFVASTSSCPNADNEDAESQL